MNNINDIDKEIFLVGFEYDTATKITFPWIKETSIPDSEKIKIHRFHNGDTNDQNTLKEILHFDRPEYVKVVEIFCGHGNNTALLGPPMNSATKHNEFYKLSMISPSASSLFAFCCYSGGLFGVAYSLSKNKVFMGFTEKIFLPLEVTSELKSIFQDIASAIIIEGEITEKHEKDFKNLITKLMGKVENGEIECEDSDFVLYYLHNYISALKRL